MRMTTTNVKVTVIDKANRPDAVKIFELNQIFNLIKNDESIKIKIQEVREANDEQYRKMKLELQQIIFSGVFRRRANDEIESYSGLLVVDLDSKDIPGVKLVEMKTLLAQDPYIYAIFVSPSGKGLKLLVRVAEPLARVPNVEVLKKSHAASAKTFFSYLKDVYGLNADRNGSDLSRACFVSHDPELVINEEAKIFRFKNSLHYEDIPNEKVDLSLIECALQAIPFGEDFPYHDWLRIGLALSSALGVDKAVELMLKYGNHPNDTKEYLYERFKNPNGKLSLGTVFWYARQYGWEFPKSQKNNSSLVSGDGHTLNSLVFINASEIKPQPIQWIWKDRIARGKLHLIAGDPGLGKSQLAIYLAATVSRGGNWADGKGKAPCGKVILICSEDDYTNVVVPRLYAAGANLNKILLLDNNIIQPFSLAKSEHIKQLNEKIDEDTVMIIIDPILSFFGTGKVDTHKSTDVRGVLEPLNRIAAEKNVSIVAITHLNKQSHVNAKNKITGSNSFVAAARIVYLVVPHPEIKDLCVMVPVKTNISRMPSGLVFSIKQTVIQYNSDIIETSHIEWHPEMDVPWTADEILKMQEKINVRNKKIECEEWLKNELARGPRKAKEILEKGKQYGFSVPTIKRAKKNLPIKTKKLEYQGEYYWELSHNNLDLFESD